MKVLIVSHGHPKLHAGGAENAAYALHKHINLTNFHASTFLAAADAGHLQPGCQIASIQAEDESIDYLIPKSHDNFFFSPNIAVDHNSVLAEFVRKEDPDVVHIHHFIHVGLEFIGALKQWSPKIKVVFTLHEYLSICPYYGQLYTASGHLCKGPTTAACLECHPERSSADLMLRDSLIRSAFSFVDYFISPSHYLLSRLSTYGVLQKPTRVIENISITGEPRPDPKAESSKDIDILRLGYFGQTNPFKGLDVILDALKILKYQGLEFLLAIHGYGLDESHKINPAWYKYRDSLRQKIEDINDRVFVMGPYRQDQISSLMQDIDLVVMGSRWPENSPLVIQEAISCCKPLVVPKLGGMEEKVIDGVHGFHYTPSSPLSLSMVLRKIILNPELIINLPIEEIDASARARSITGAHLDLYNELILASI